MRRPTLVKANVVAGLGRDEGFDQVTSPPNPLSLRGEGELECLNEFRAQAADEPGVLEAARAGSSADAWRAKGG